MLCHSSPIMKQVYIIWAYTGSIQESTRKKKEQFKPLKYISINSLHIYTSDHSCQTTLLCPHTSPNTLHPTDNYYPRTGFLTFSYSSHPIHLLYRRTCLIIINWMILKCDNHSPLRELTLQLLSFSFFSFNGI